MSIETSLERIANTLEQIAGRTTQAAPAPRPEPEAPTPKAETPVSEETLRQAAIAYAGKHGRDGTRQALRAFVPEARTLTDVPVDYWPALLKALQDG